jgi:uncharacterized coiled-coil DUF342 family protein
MAQPQQLKEEIKRLKSEQSKLVNRLAFANEEMDSLQNQLREMVATINKLNKESSEYPWEMIILDKNNDWTDEVKPLTNKQKDILEIVSDVEKNSFLNPIYLLNKCRFIIHSKFEPIPF